MGLGLKGIRPARIIRSEMSANLNSEIRTIQVSLTPLNLLVE